ncbi:MAG: L7Ae/L30e/S12e/Gadd45 family ribosomal protein [Oscillospiraceae bacterium]
MNKTKIMNLLTICRKAAKLTTGFDSVKESIGDGSAEVVILASDISPKTEKEVRFFADKKKMPVLKTDISMEEMYGGIGKKAAVMSVCDKGFAEKFTELASE